MPLMILLLEGIVFMAEYALMDNAVAVVTIVIVVVERSLFVDLSLRSPFTSFRPTLEK